MRKREKRTAALGLLAAVFVAAGSGVGATAVPQLAVPEQAVCRVTNRCGGVLSIGSGTLIDTSAADGTDAEGADAQGLVLTCAHLFAEGVGEIVVEFPGGKSHGGRLVAVDRDADLGAVVIARPAGAAAAVEFGIGAQQRLSACGFGPDGVFRCATGPVVGAAEHAGQWSVMIGDAVRNGDSGGGVFDAEGRLVAVVWGEASGVTYASSGAPLRRFVQRVLGRRAGVVAEFAGQGGTPQVCGPRGCGPSTCKPPSYGPCAEGSCPPLPVATAPSPRGPALSSPVARPAQPESVAAGVAARLEALGSRVEALAAAMPGGLGSAGKKSWSEIAAGWLGIGGGLGWCVLVGGWLVSKVWQRCGVGGRRREPFPGRSGAGN